MSSEEAPSVPQKAPSVSSMEDLLSCRVAQRVMAEMTDKDTKEIDEIDLDKKHKQKPDLKLNKSNSSSSSDSIVHLDLDDPGEEVLVSPASTSGEVLVSPSSTPGGDGLSGDFVFKGWGDNAKPVLPKVFKEQDLDSADVDAPDEAANIIDKFTMLRTNWGANTPSKKNTPSKTVDDSNQRQSPSKQQQNPLKVWNEKIRQTPKNDFWQGVFKNRGRSSPKNQNKKDHAKDTIRAERTTPQGELQSKGATCDDGEDGLLVDMAEDDPKEKRSQPALSCPSDTSKGINILKPKSLDRKRNLPKQRKSPSRSTTYQPSTGTAPSLFGLQIPQFPQRDKQQSATNPPDEYFQVMPYYLYPSEFRMNETELYHEMMRPSENFEVVESRSQSRQIGEIKVEILSCIGLAKVDRYSPPNATVYLICGDTAFATDSIASISPMWPARSKRAVKIPLFHAYAKLYLGIFNATDKDVDDFAGRAAISVSSLRQDVEYDVNFPLKVSTGVFDERPRGVLRVRFSLYWFDERSAVLSYLPATRHDLPWLGDNIKQDFLTVPCADSKALRNVAYTVYGSDLPSKFSRRAFRATTREMGLYKVNLQFIIKSEIWDTMLYKCPLVSLYVFAGWMGMIYFNKINLVPSFLVSYIIIVFYRNYLTIIPGEDGDDNFQPLSLADMVSMLWCGHRTSRTKESAPKTSCIDLDEYRRLIQNSIHTEKDHGEFPFSHKEIYKPRHLGKMFVLSQPAKNQKVPVRKVGKVFKAADKDNYTCTRDIPDESAGPKEDFISERDDDSGYGSDQSKGDVIKSMRPHGPEQNDEVDAKEGNLFKKNFSELENRLHFCTGNIFHRYISRPLRSNEEHLKPEKIIPEPQMKFTNPLAALTASFLEPVMKAIEVYLLAVRASFNAFTWKDPYLSFWILVFLFIFMLFLALFPWRLFFCLTGIGCFGPQNLVVKYFISRRNRRTSTVTLQEGAETAEESVIAQVDPIHRIIFKFPKKNDCKTEEIQDSQQKANLFSASTKRQKEKKGQDDKLYEIIVPYNRFETERFSFWPPYSHQNPTFIDRIVCESGDGATEQQNKKNA